MSAQHCPIDVPQHRSGDTVRQSPHHGGRMLEEADPQPLRILDRVRQVIQLQPRFEGDITVPVPLGRDDTSSVDISPPAVGLFVPARRARQDPIDHVGADGHHGPLNDLAARAAMIEIHDTRQRIQPAAIAPPIRRHPHFHLLPRRGVGVPQPHIGQVAQSLNAGAARGSSTERRHLLRRQARVILRVLELAHGYPHHHREDDLVVLLTRVVILIDLRIRLPALPFHDRAIMDPELSRAPGRILADRHLIVLRPEHRRHRLPGPVVQDTQVLPAPLEPAFGDHQRTS